jgi:hypothetical protein
MLSRREALGAILALPMFGAQPQPDVPLWPAWATSWDDAAASMATFEESGIRHNYPLTGHRLTYVGAIQWNPDVVMVYGCRDFDAYRRHGEFWGDVLGRGVSRRGTCWALFARARMSPQLRAEVCTAGLAMEEEFRQAERRARQGGASC